MLTNISASFKIFCKSVAVAVNKGSNKMTAFYEFYILMFLGEKVLKTSFIKIVKKLLIQIAFSQFYLATNIEPISKNKQCHVVFMLCYRSMTQKCLKKTFFQQQFIGLMTDLEQYIIVVNFSSVQRTGNIEQEENGNSSVTSLFFATSP